MWFITECLSSRYVPESKRVLHQNAQICRVGLYSALKPNPPYAAINDSMQRKGKPINEENHNTLQVINQA